LTYAGGGDVSAFDGMVIAEAGQVTAEPAIL
jgi:hypothetical protein